MSALAPLINSILREIKDLSPSEPPLVLISRLAAAGFEIKPIDPDQAPATPSPNSAPSSVPGAPEVHPQPSSVAAQLIAAAKGKRK